MISLVAGCTTGSPRSWCPLFGARLCTSTFLCSTIIYVATVELDQLYLLDITLATLLLPPNSSFNTLFGVTIHKCYKHTAVIDSATERTKNLRFTRDLLFRRPPVGCSYRNLYPELWEESRPTKRFPKPGYLFVYALTTTAA